MEGIAAGFIAIGVIYAAARWALNALGLLG
jgi:hypothetical protein